VTGGFVGIDVGTTATKAVLINANGEVLTRARVPHLAHPSAGAGRVSPASWWESVRGACTTLDVRIPILGVGLSAHSPVVVPMGSTGEPVADAYRFEAPGMPEAVQAMFSSVRPADLHRIGNRPSPSTAIVSAYHLLQNDNPASLSDLRTLGSVATFIGQKLTGHAAIDPSQASYFGLLDLTGDWTWMDDLAERVGVPKHTLPAICSSTSVLGELTADAAAELRLPAGVPVVLGAGDTACAAAAVGLEEQDERMLTLGTTHVVTEHTTTPSTRRVHLQRAHVRNGEWLLHGTLNGGLALGIGAQSLGFGSGTTAVTDLLRTANQADADLIRAAPTFIPHVRAERAPFWLDTPVTTMVGDHSSPTAMAWAVAEGVAFGDRLVWESFEHADGGRVILAGDVGADTVFPQMIADVLGTPVELLAESHLPALGAACLAAAAIGLRIKADVSEYRRIHPREPLMAVLQERWRRFAEVRAESIGNGEGSRCLAHERL
jgi:xylulokinase